MLAVTAPFLEAAAEVGQHKRYNCFNDIHTVGSLHVEHPGGLSNLAQLALRMSPRAGNCRAQSISIEKAEGCSHIVKVKSPALF